jgi:hydrogenase-4 membrane subunit HyfE
LTWTALLLSDAWRAPGLFLAAIVVAGLNVLLLPRILRRLITLPGLVQAQRGWLPPTAEVASMLALTGIAFVLLPPGRQSGIMPPLAFAIWLQGLLMLAARRGALSQAVGFLAATNGLALLVVGLAVPFAAGILLALLLPSLLLLWGLDRFRPGPVLHLPDQEKLRALARGAG